MPPMPTLQCPALCTVRILENNLNVPNFINVLFILLSYTVLEGNCPNVKDLTR